MAITLLSNVAAVNGKPEAKATGLITCVAKASLADTDYFTMGDCTTRVTCVTKANLASGDYFTITDTKKMVKFQLNKSGTDTSLGAEYVNVDCSSATTAIEVAALVVTAINAVQNFNVLATDLLDGRFIVESEIYDPDATLTVTENVTNAGFSTAARTEIYHFDTAGDGVTAGHVQVNVSTDTTAADVAARLTTAINACVAFRVLATDNATGTVTVTRTNTLVAGNVTLTENVANGTFAVTGFTGGVKSVAGVQLTRAWRRHNYGDLHVWSTAGSGAMSVTLRMWGQCPASLRWIPLGTGDADAKGVINEGAAIAESSPNAIIHAETLDNLSGWLALYLEVTAIGGTATAISAALLPRNME